MIDEEEALAEMVSYRLKHEKDTLVISEGEKWFKSLIEDFEFNPGGHEPIPLIRKERNSVIPAGTRCLNFKISTASAIMRDFLDSIQYIKFIFSEKRSVKWKIGLMGRKTRITDNYKLIKYHFVTGEVF